MLTSLSATLPLSEYLEDPVMDPLSVQNIKLVAKNHINNNELLEARQLLQPASKDYADDAEIWFLLGLAEQRLDNAKFAVTCFTRTIALNPASASAHFYLAQAQLAMRQPREAVAHFKQSITLDPEFTPAHLQLGAVYNSLGQPGKSGQHLKAVLQKQPRNRQALLMLAYNQMLFGKLDQAQEYFQSVLEEKKDAIMAVTGLANVFARKGRFDDALELLKPFLECEKPDPNIAIAFSTVCQHTNQCGYAATLLEGILADPATSTDDQRNILFALGKLYDHAHDYSKAFACIAKANNLKQVDTDTALTSVKTAAFIQIWSAEFNSRLPASGPQIGHIQPVFIVGMPRSGSTLIEQIISAHPAVYGAGELKEFGIGVIMEQLPQSTGTCMRYPECLEVTNSALLTSIATDYLIELASLSGAGHSMVTDKTLTNFWNLGLIKLLFPDAKIIHSTRNPLDTCISCYFTDFADGNFHTFELESLGNYYRLYRKMMQHWKVALHIPMLEISYEHLVSNPEVASRELIEYCGLNWDESCLSPHKSLRDVATASYAQVRQPVYTSSIDRWKHYQEHIQVLREVLENPVSR